MAQSVSSFYLEFALSRVKAILQLRLTNFACSLILQAFNPHPFVSVDQDKVNMLCPLVALECYIHQTAQWHKTEQLPVCFSLSK